MNDIVERLQKAAKKYIYERMPLCAEAASEIETLTAQRDALEKAVRVVRLNLPGDVLHLLILRDENESNPRKWPSIDDVIKDALATVDIKFAAQEKTQK